ncbi:MAG: ribonuclease P protein component [Gemmatimonadales bacterium]
MGARDPVAPPQEGTQAPQRAPAVQASESLTNQRYPRHVRLSRGAELTSCWEAGRRHRTPHLELAWRHNALGHARTGLIVPRFGGSAVARNRLRRRLREIVRRDLLRQLPPIDLVIRVKRSASAAPFAVLRAELTGVAGTLT